MKHDDIVLLLDIYGELLSKGQREALDMRYNADLTLSEIGEELGGVSRQSASCSVRNGEKKLIELEYKLGIAKRLKTLSKLLDKACSKLNDIRYGIRADACGTICGEKFDELYDILMAMENEL